MSDELPIPLFPELKSFLEDRETNLLEAYRLMPDHITEHKGFETKVQAGGYGYRQILELVQNGADAILEQSEAGVMTTTASRIDVVLSGRHLYVANTGAPITLGGLKALLGAHMSPKRGNQIGRFGVGFKSLLRLEGGIDLFTRTSGVIRFMPDRCVTRIREACNTKEAPALRLAWAYQIEDLAPDPMVESLSWAETLVRAEIGNDQALSALKAEIADFPSELLLFLPVSIELNLDDGESPRRTIRIQAEGKQRKLTVGDVVSEWSIVTKDIKVTEPKALSDATDIHKRDSIPLNWAIPVNVSREERGRFWAFFPTETASRIPGILNAPWKLNDDRTSLIRGPWNSHLMKEAARMVVDEFSSLVTTDDPGRALDFFPRGSDAQEIAAPLLEAIWQLVEVTEIIPNANGALVTGRDLCRHPTENSELIRAWEEIAPESAKNTIVHSSCNERARNARLAALSERYCRPNPTGAQSQRFLKTATASSWFGCVASAKTEECLAVLRLAKDWSEKLSASDWKTIRRDLEIIATANGTLAKPDEIILLPKEATPPSGLQAVHPDLLALPEAARILREQFGIKELDASYWKQLLSNSLGAAEKSFGEAKSRQWSILWQHLRQAPKGISEEFSEEWNERIHVRSASGDWLPPTEVLFAGKIVYEDDGENRGVLVDTEFHRNDGNLLCFLGVSDQPSANSRVSVPREQLLGVKGLLTDWLSAVRTLYKNTHHNQARRENLEPKGLLMPAGWMLLPRLRGMAAARMTKHLMARVSESGQYHECILGHSSVKSYAEMKVPHALNWLILSHGRWSVGRGVARFLCALEICDLPAARRLREWQHIEACLSPLNAAKALFEASPKDDALIFWHRIFEQEATAEAMSEDRLDDLWQAAASSDYGVVPSSLPLKDRNIPLSEVFITDSRELAARVRSEDRLIVTLDSKTLAFWAWKGAKKLSEHFKPSWKSSEISSMPLSSAFPEFTEVLSDQYREKAGCQLVVELALELDGSKAPVPCLMWDELLLVDMERLSTLPLKQRRQALLAEMATAGWLSMDVAAALEKIGDEEVHKRRAYVAAGETLAQRLLRAVGEKAEGLHPALGGLLSRGFIRGCDVEQLAELALSRMGSAILPTVVPAMEEQGLRPPGRWNSPEARLFVAEIGFPPEFAVSPASKRNAEEVISGPIHLPPLHDFQNEVVGGITRLLDSGKPRKRAVVSLPTGGGKTRVTVEACVLLVLKPETDRRSVLWIAQTDELCEQAVQAFRQVWLNRGAENTDLRISRLWGSNPSPAPPGPGKPVVVVASIQTLNARMGNPSLEWLNRPGIVVVDECHHAITTSYTSLLRWLDAEATRGNQEPKDEPAILGLSATPFRTDEDESVRLAKRFDGIWFPHDQASLHDRLLKMGALAHAERVPLPSTAALLPQEMEFLESENEWEGLKFDQFVEALNQRLAEDQKRNRLIIETIQKSAEKSILLFANSVSHAEELAARLHLAGIPAAAISGTTPRSARRWFLDRFQHGEIRVLCNHSVLTTGFDAPKTDLVFISRQVFSPVRYMQMVGRGLRGELNGGTTKCRIVTVLDNLGRFGNRHPYHYCARYFQSEGSLL